jgi:hypothetical protein
VITMTEVGNDFPGRDNQLNVVFCELFCRAIVSGRRKELDSVDASILRGDRG